MKDLVTTAAAWVVVLGSLALLAWFWVAVINLIWNLGQAVAS